MIIINYFIKEKIYRKKPIKFVSVEETISY